MSLRSSLAVFRQASVIVSKTEEEEEEEEEPPDNLYSVLAGDSLRAWWRVFRKSDRAGDGAGDGEVSTTDVGLILRELGIKLSDAAVNDLVLSADLDGSGAIDFEEFTGMMLRIERQLKLSELMRERPNSRVFRALLEARAGRQKVALFPRPRGSGPSPSFRMRLSMADVVQQAQHENERQELLSFIDELWYNKSTLSLSLAGCGLVDPMVCIELARVLSFSPTTRLHTLNLSGNHGIGDAGAVHLANGLRGNRHLRFLLLDSTDIGDEGASALLSSLGDVALQSLSLRGNPRISPPVLNAIRNTLHDTLLREAFAKLSVSDPCLFLRWIRIPPRKLGMVRQALLARVPSAGASSRGLTRGGSLHRKGSGASSAPPATRQSSAATASPSSSPRKVDGAQLVRRLDLSGNSESGDAIADFLASIRKPGLQTDRPLLSALAKLDTLRLQQCGVSDSGALALAHAIHSGCLPDLTCIDLRDNLLGWPRPPTQVVHGGSAPDLYRGMSRMSRMSSRTMAEPPELEPWQRRAIEALAAALARQCVVHLRLDGNAQLRDESASILLHDVLNSFQVVSSAIVSSAIVSSAIVSSAA